MEPIAQSVEDHLIDALSFKLRPGASYISNRRSVTYFPQGGNDYSPNGVKGHSIDADRRQLVGP